MTAGRYLCPVCGFPNLEEPPWNNDAGSDEICPSCGTHFGYDDAAGGDAAARETVYRRLRARWHSVDNQLFSVTNAYKGELVDVFGPWASEMDSFCRPPQEAQVSMERMTFCASRTHSSGTSTCTGCSKRMPRP